MKRFALVGLLVSLCYYGQAQQPGVTTSFTAGLMNGRAWLSFPEVAKGMYLAGIKDACFGVTIMQDTTPPPQNDYWAASFAVKDYKAELDSLYKDRENIRIPIVLAVRYITTKLKGDRTQEDLEQGLLTLREWISEVK